MKLIGILITVSLVVVFIGCIVVYAVRLRKLKKQEQIRINDACGVNGGGSVFVEIIGYNQSSEIAATIASCLENAHCPLRIYFGVYDISDNGDSKTVINEYEGACKFTKSPLCLKDHIRVLHVKPGEQRGILAALDQVERHLYHGEEYICNVQSGALFNENWEQKCVDMIGSTVQVAITSVLGESKTVGTYTSIGTSGQMVPMIMQGSTDKLTVPALTWSSSFSFTMADRMKNIPYAQIFDIAPTGLDYVALDMFTTVKLLDYGWSLLHPVQPVAYTRVCKHENGHGSTKWRSDVRGLNRSKPTILRKLGISTTHILESGLKLSVRAQLGLTEHATDQEIKLKLGSKDEYLNYISRFELLV
jgi:hypothetical protein